MKLSGQQEFTAASTIKACMQNKCGVVGGIDIPWHTSYTCLKYNINYKLANVKTHASLCRY